MVVRMTDSVPPAARARPDDPAPARGRGLVLYVGLSEAAADAAGTSLQRVAGGLQAVLDAVLPAARSAYTVVASDAGDGVGDLDAVRAALAAAVAPFGVPGGDTGLRLEVDRRCVHADGRRLALTPSEFRLLLYLVEHAGYDVARSALLTAVWGADAPQHERAVDVCVRRLRTKLGRYRNIVRTVRGSGYRFDEHPDVRINGLHQR